MKKIYFIICVMIFSMFYGLICNTFKVYASELHEENTEENNGASDSVSYSSGRDYIVLDVEGGVPQLPFSVDYSGNEGLIKYLKPGDLIYQTVSLSSLTGHTALVYDVLYSEEYEQYYVVVIEAIPSDGVVYSLLTPTRFIEKECQITRLMYATEAEINNAITWAQNQIGKNYFIDVTKNPSPNNNTWYCSELVWAAFYWQGIYLDQDDNLESGGSIVYPSEINDYEYAKLIMHYLYGTTCVAVNDVNHNITCNGEVFTETHEYISLNSCFDICEMCNHTKQIIGHQFNDHYLVSDSTNHYAYCSCGNYIIEEHDFSMNNVSGKKVCIDCGYSENISHKHSYTYLACGDGIYHIKNCSCGTNAIEACLGFSQADGYTHCRKCGQIIGGGGNIMFGESVVAIPSSLDCDNLLIVEKEDES